MFEGIRFYPQLQPEYQYRPHSKEAIKTDIIKKFIPIHMEEDLPGGILSDYEKVSIFLPCVICIDNFERSKCKSILYCSVLFT